MPRKRHKLKLPNVLITGGDPAGIGPELLELVLDKSLPKLIQKHPQTYYIYFSTYLSSSEIGILHETRIRKICERNKLYFKSVGYNFDAITPIINSAENKAKFIFCNPDARKLKKYLLRAKFQSSEPLKLGQASPLSGALSFLALEEASNFALANIDNAAKITMFTAPLAKEWVTRGIKAKFRGHTDYLAERFNSNVLMLMHGVHLSVIPLTVHIPLKKVAKKIKSVLKNPALPKLLAQVKKLDHYAKHNWAICGLNPHAGENDLIGNEEKYLRKFCQGLFRENGIVLDGPLPADSLFMSKNRVKYRLILSCYHDQGLIPFKALEENRGVNCTIGLPFLRTSPNHGTAFSLAGTRKADIMSMQRAFELAVQGLTIN